MFLRQLDLTTALRPNLYDDETLLFVQDGVGLYFNASRLPTRGSAYLTSHRVCYVDNEDPRRNPIAVDLKEVERADFYAGFLRSSAKITLFPKPSKRGSQVIKSPVPRYATPEDGLVGLSNAVSRSVSQSPAPVRDANATWICPICGLSNPVPTNFDPSTANQHTPLPPCQACGIKPPLVTMVKAAIAAMSNRASGASSTPQTSLRRSIGPDSRAVNGGAISSGTNECPRCTFQNHPSLSTCELCGAPLQNIDAIPRTESPAPAMSGLTITDDNVESIKLSFRAGGEKTFHDRLKGALVQRKWLLQNAPPIPKPQSITPSNNSPWSLPNGSPRAGTPQQRVVGIAGLERRGAEIRENAQAVIGTAFEDLDALMTSAKEVIAMAEQFAKQTDNGVNAESVAARNILSDSASALGLVTTKDMLGTGSASESLYITELARNLAEFLTDDRRGILRKEGGIMSLVDLWAVFNRTRNGMELISPLEFEKAAAMWESLHLPIRLRRFKSGLLVVQEKSRTDDKTILSLLSWLREPHYAFPPSGNDLLVQTFGRGITAQETAERFRWSVGVATEELEMAEDAGALCRDQCLDGTRFWENHFTREYPEERILPAQTMHMTGEGSEHSAA